MPLVTSATIVPAAANPDQLNADGDNYGNECDNCPDAHNDDQADNDDDGEGDACDEDDDNDNVLDTRIIARLSPTPIKRIMTMTGKAMRAMTMKMETASPTLTINVRRLR